MTKCVYLVQNVVVGGVVVYRCCCRHLDGVNVEIRVECAVPETHWGVLAPDFAVGTGTGVHKG